MASPRDAAGLGTALPLQSVCGGMIPNISNPKWQRLVRGEIAHRFDTSSASMLMFNLQAKIRKDPSPATLSACVKEAYDFFQKYERVFAADLAQIFQ